VSIQSEMIAMPLPLKRLDFSFVPDARWGDDSLQIGFALRGALGLSLAKGCCFFNARAVQCDGCAKRAHCHYGQSFKTAHNIQLSDDLKVGCMPHAWSLHIDRVGMAWCASLKLAGFEVAYLASWQSAIQSLPLDVSLQHVAWEKPSLERVWSSLTPVRLKYRGRTPANADEAGMALLTSIVSKSKMLAAIHGLSLPDTRLANPKIINASWHKGTRMHQQTKKEQSMSGWLLEIVWPEDTSEVWQMWLWLASRLGVGKQTSFGMGRFHTSLGHHS